PGTGRGAGAAGASPARRRRRRPRIARSAAERLVERRVDELVGADVALAPDRAHRPAVELAPPAPRLQEDRLRAGVLAAVLAADLARDQLGVVDDLHVRRPQLARQLQAEQDGAVLRDVVGGLADELAALP